MKASQEFPARLLDEGDETALLIQRALSEPAPGPSEAQSWRKLREHKSAPARARWVVPALALAAAVGAAMFWLARPEPALVVTPDQWREAPSPREAAPERRLSAPEPLPSARPSPPKPIEPRASSEPENATAACAALAQAGKYEPASDCYARIARGGSMSAELALYEKARLEAKALGHSERALDTLNEHARRFPAGMLSSEVGLTRIELLSQLGRRAEALTAIEQALGGALGRERGADLQVLRAELLAGQGDCAAARAAAQSAEKAGAHPSRLGGVQRRCPAAEPTVTPDP
jgi:tetratricopeptide (TPR) repeat protein